MFGLAGATLAVFLLNVPFGYWRAGVRKFSLAWFLAVHGPVPFVVALRMSTGLSLVWYVVLAMVAAYFAGQFVGGRMRQRRPA